MDKLKLIERVVRNNKAYTSEVIAKAIVEVLDESSVIASKIAELNEDKLNLEKNFKKYQKEKDEEISKLQLRCSHPSTTYNPDPSGNSDSFYECDICGKEV